MDMDIFYRMIRERNSYSVLEIIDVVSGTRIKLHEFESVVEAPNWTRDGGYLVYNSMGRIFTYDLTYGTIKEIHSGFAVFCNNDHILSPDNSEIAISHHTAPEGRSLIYRMPITGGTPKLITENGPSYLHGWSPDGKSLTYCSERFGQYDIFTTPVDGGSETQLTHQPEKDDGPEYSPDGKYIWFNSARSGLMQIWRMDADGGNPTRMVDEEANCWFPHVSPDGNLVAYLAYRKEDTQPEDHPANKNVEIRLISAQGGPSKTIACLFGGQGTLNVNSWSPDSRKIAFVSYKPKLNLPQSSTVS